VELRQQLRLRGKKVTGTKAQLVARLLETPVADVPKKAAVPPGHSKHVRPLIPKEPELSTVPSREKGTEIVSKSGRVAEARVHGDNVADVVDFVEVTEAGKRLTQEQEYALARAIRAGDRIHKLKTEHEAVHGAPLDKRDWAALAGLCPNDLRRMVSAYRTAKQELVSNNIGLVHAVVKNYAGRARRSGVPLEELVQEGVMGLLRAAELFDPERGLRFSTYATVWIKGALSNSHALDGTVTVPLREKALRNKVSKVREDLEQMAGRTTPVAAEEIAARLDLAPAKVEDSLRRAGCVSNVLSLDYRYASTTRSGHADGMSESLAFDGTSSLASSTQFGVDGDRAEIAHLQADVVVMLADALSEKERTLMRLRYGLEDGTERTVKECAATMGINRETARLLHNACLKKLRGVRDAESLQEYLLTVA